MLSSQPQPTAPTSTTELPTATFGLDEVRTKCNSFLKEFDDWVLRKKTAIIDSREQFNKGMSEDTEKFLQAHRQLETVSERKQYLQSSIDSIKEETTELANIVNNLKTKSSTLSNQKSDLITRMNALKTEIQQKRLMINKRRQELAEAKLKSQPELEAYQKYLGLAVRAKGKDVLAFTFDNIDPNDHEKKFEFVLDIAGREARYAVTSHSPSHPTIASLVQKLNTDQDFYYFLKMVRKGWQESL